MVKLNFWQRPDLLQRLVSSPDFDRLAAIRKDRQLWIQSDHWRQKASAIQSLLEMPEMAEDFETDCRSPTISACPGKPLRERPEQLETLSETATRVARDLMPWRKGPFRLLDQWIDAEWRSDQKWKRLAPALPDLKDKRIVDIGCGNGYYMFRAAADEPDSVLGLDPSVLFYLQFELIQAFIRAPMLQMELLGVEHLDFFQECFDVVFCMGVLYHQKNPVQNLIDIRRTLRKGGSAMIESQVIPGEGSWALFPPDRYAKARNVFFVPTVSCLQSWIARAGFRHQTLVSVDKTTFDEQRKTDWMTFESLEDFLDPRDCELTIEGHPAPWRAIVRADL